MSNLSCINKSMIKSYEFSMFAYSQYIFKNILLQKFQKFWPFAKKLHQIAEHPFHYLIIIRLYIFSRHCQIKAIRFFKAIKKFVKIIRMNSLIGIILTKVQCFDQFKFDPQQIAHRKHFFRRLVRCCNRLPFRSDQHSELIELHNRLVGQK